jgi:hypothetical protein
MKRVVVIIAILVAAAACGGTVGEGTSRAYSGPQQSNGSAVGAPTKISGQPGGGAGNSGNPSNPSNPSSTDSLVPPLAGPPVIRQAQLGITVSSGAFDSKLSELRSIVEVAGGYIAGTDAQVPPSDSQIRTGVINFMVPAANFDSVLDQLATVGKLQNEHITGLEVGSQYVDLRARLANAEAQRNAMLTLLTQAKTISDIIAVQNQIGQITVQMEQLKGQIKYLDDNTSYSSVSVKLTEAAAPAQAASSDSWGFATALSNAGHNFVTTINYAITALGAVGPFLVLLGLGYVLWRRRSSLLPRRA